MKSLTLIAFLVSSTLAQEFECPRNPNTGACMDGNYPNPVDCGSFYQCANCIRYIQYCPPGTHYSPRADACVDPVEAKCVVSTLAPSTTTPTPSTTTPPTTEPPTTPPPTTIAPTTTPPTTQPPTTQPPTTQPPTTQPPTTQPPTTQPPTTEQPTTQPPTTQPPTTQPPTTQPPTTQPPTTQPPTTQPPTTQLPTTEPPTTQPPTTQPPTTVPPTTQPPTTEPPTTQTPTTAGPTPAPTIPPVPPQALNARLFFAARKDILIGVATPVVYDIVVETNSAFNANQTYTAAGDGLYFSSLSAGALFETGLNFDLKIDFDNFVDVFRSSTSHTDIDTTSRDIIASLTAGQNMFTTSTALGMYSDDQLQTSWLVFGLHESMDHVIGFCGAKNGTSTGPRSPLTYDAVLAAAGGGFDHRSGIFTAPQEGVYYFSVSAGTESRDPAELRVVRNGADVVGLTSTSFMNEGVDIMSRSVAIYLEKSDTVAVNVIGDSTVYSDEEYQTSFCGFLYSPMHLAPVSWSVGKNTNATFSDLTRGIGFNVILQNQGMAWNASADALYVPITGYYLVQISAGALPSTRVHLILFKNDDQALVDLWRPSDTHNGVNTLSRSAVVLLEAGDVLRVGGATGTGCYSDNLLQTSFSGFLLYRFS